MKAERLALGSPHRMDFHRLLPSEGRPGSHTTARWPNPDIKPLHHFSNLKTCTDS